MKSKRLAGVGVLVVVLVIMAGCKPRAADPLVDAYGNKDYVTALRLSAERIANGSDGRVDRVLHAWSLFQLGYLKKADQEFRSLVRENEESFHGWLGQAWVAMKTGRWQRVPGLLDQAQRWMGQHQRPMLYAARGWAAFYQGRIDEAERRFDEVEGHLYFEDAEYISLPESIMQTWNTLPWVGRGWVAIARGDLSRAEGLFRRGIEHDASCHLCYGGLTEVASRRGDIDLAIDHARKGLAVSRHDPELVATLNRLLWKKNDPALSLEVYQGLVQESRNDPLYQANLGYLYLYRGDYEKARSLFRQALKAEPGQALATTGLSRLSRLVQRG